MARRKTPAPLQNFDNPSEIDYAKANELRPSFELTADELRYWDEITPWLAKNKRLQPWYKHTLIEYCRTLASIGKIVQYFRDHPDKEYYVVTGRNGQQKKADPRVAQLNEARRLLRTYVNDFGLTPAAERQLEVVQEDIINAFTVHDAATR